MDLFEYQARDIFEKHGVPVLGGVVATTPEEARAGAEQLLGGQPGVVVVKAQVKVGGRGKAGGVKLARSADDAAEKATEILGMDIKGHTVHRVMIAAGAKIATEFYFSLLLDRAERRYLAMCSVEGGMDIEQLAVERPDALAKVAVDPRTGIDQAKADEIVAAAGFDAEHRPQGRRGAADAVDRLPQRGRHARRGEPAGPHRGRRDRRARRQGHARRERGLPAPGARRRSRTPPRRTRSRPRAKEEDLNYVKLDGEVGIIGNGAGLVMSTLDVVAYAGEAHGGVKPANFLDIGGGASAEIMAAGLDIILTDPQVKSVFVNVFGGITACDAVANGIVAALEILGDEASKPLVVRLDGNNVLEGRRILAEAGHPLVTIADTMDGGADKAAELAHAAA